MRMQRRILPIVQLPNKGEYIWSGKIAQAILMPFILSKITMENKLQLHPDREILPKDSVVSLLCLSAACNSTKNENWI